MATDNLFKTVQNPGAISGYRFSNRAGRTGEDYEYLVITRNTYRTEFDTLISFYRERGITTRVATLEHIDSVSAGTDMQQKIRNYIIDEYLDHGIAFVLLGGDVEIVPYRGFYCTVLSGGSYMTDNSIPSDLYYSALDGSWDDDLDGIWGEPDEDDLFPEVAVGRLTFSDSVELHNMLHKSFAYQSSPVPGELTHPLLAGEHLWSSPITWGSDYLNLLIGLRSDNGYTTLGIQPTQAIDSMYDEYGNWSKADLMARINSGRPWLHHVGHANYTYAMKMSNSDITNANFSGSNGIDHNYCIVYTHGCNCGGFDNSDCIAEKMVGIDNFAVSFIGNSRYGWFVEGTTDGPSQHLHREFLDALFGDSLYQAGAALMRSKTETAPFVDMPGEYEPGATRWCFYDNYLLGDPMMAMWTQEPLELLVDYDPLIPAGADSLVVLLSYPGLTCSGYRCSLLRNDTIYGMAFTDATGKAVIPIEDFLDCSEARLVITGYNILPEILPVTISDYWLGFTTDWNEASNWYSGAVPDANSSVIIPPSPIGTKFPLTNSGPPRQCKAILIKEGGLSISCKERLLISWATNNLLSLQPPKISDLHGARGYYPSWYYRKCHL